MEVVFMRENQTCFFGTRHEGTLESVADSQKTFWNKYDHAVPLAHLLQTMLGGHQRGFREFKEGCYAITEARTRGRGNSLG